MTTINFYDAHIANAHNGLVDMDTDGFEIALMNSSHTFTAGNADWADVSANQIATGNGYTQADGAGGGKTLASVTSDQSGGTYAFDAGNVTWTASGGDIGPATDAVIMDYDATGDKLVCSIDFEGAKTANDTTTFVINFNASGIYTVG